MNINDMLSTYDFEKHESDNEELVEYWKHILQSGYYKPIELFDTKSYSDVDIKLHIQDKRLQIENIEESIEEIEGGGEIKEGKSEIITEMENRIKENRYELQLLNTILTVREKVSHEFHMYDEKNFDSVDNSFEQVLRQVIKRHVESNEEQVEELVELFSNQ